MNAAVATPLNTATTTGPAAPQPAPTPSKPPPAPPLEWAKALAAPLATVLITGIGGWTFTTWTQNKQRLETNERLYAQLLMQREASDAGIRKDMFGVVIKNFLADTSRQDWTDRILQLELLANNFSQSLDLSPLFKDIVRRLPMAPELNPAARAELQRRIDQTARGIIFKQITSLARRGFEIQGGLPAGRWESIADKPVLAKKLPLALLATSAPDAPIAAQDHIQFLVDVVGADLDRRELDIRLRVNFSREPERNIDQHFIIGRYDLPMLENVQLPYGLRAAVAITEFDVPDIAAERTINSFATLHLVVFPASSASFKERQDYDDILHDMLRSRRAGPAAQGASP